MSSALSHYPLGFRVPISALLGLVALAAHPATARAQATPTNVAAAQGGQDVAADSIFLHAQRLVAEGNGTAGRALVAQQLASAPPRSVRYVEALYWRATLAATAADAERDYKRLIIEFPLSPRAEDALVQLAQLEMARGDRAQALRHLERVVLEHPTSPARARARSWMARVLFEEGNAARACARLDDARRSAPSDAVELRNQIAYDAQRCEGVDTTVVAASGAPVSPVPRATAPSAGTPAQAAPGPPVEFTVQVAAYGARESAERLRATLLARGYGARVVPAGPTIYRVYVGRYASREAALTAAERLKANKVVGDAIVKEAEPR